MSEVFLHRRADVDKVAELKKVLRETGVGLSSVLQLHTWSSPDEAERQADSVAGTGVFFGRPACI